MLLKLFRQKRYIILLVFGCAMVYVSITSSVVQERIPHFLSITQNYELEQNVNSSVGPTPHPVSTSSSKKDDLNEKVTVPGNQPQETSSTVSRKMGCELPLLNPFARSIRKFNVAVKPFKCQKLPQYPVLFKTDLKSTLIQVDKPENHGYSKCCYRSFKRKTEIEVVLSKKCNSIQKEKTTISHNSEFIQISCKNTSAKHSSKQIVDMFGFVHLKKSVEDRIRSIEANDTNLFLPAVGANITSTENTPSSPVTEPPDRNKNQTTRRVNVVIFGIDSVSHMNLIRTMPLSYKYLTGNLSGLGLWGYTKVADNTFPNIVPVLSGLFVKELIKKRKCRYNKPFDHCPFLWKNYSSQGYRTAFGEDAVWMGMFRYSRYGFKNPPTDYYLNTLTDQQSLLNGHGTLKLGHFCYGPRFAFQVLLDYLQKMAVAMNKTRRYFQLVWPSSLTHNDLNMPKLVDRYLLETLQWFKSEGYFEDTVFILMSDHGFHVGGIRNTLQGKIEERMPFLYFVFPQWFRERYSSAVSNVMANKHRLTTPFDLHETLKDLLFLDNIKSDNIRHRHLNLQGKLKQSAGLPRGISLFLPIPLKRTCKDAQIPGHWCVCQKTKSVVVKNNSLVREAAKSVVYFINEMFAAFPQCLKLYLQEILNAQVFQSANKKVADAAANITSSFDPRLNKQQVTFRLSLKVSPSNATFEATATRHTNGEWTVSGDISRTNLYGQQSRCVEDFNLKKFCYCG